MSAGPPWSRLPDSAVLDTGATQAVLVERGEGLYEPREVKVGARAGGFVEILDGVKEGEKVVVRANFLIDAESNLRAALQGFHNHSARPVTRAPHPEPPSIRGASRNPDGWTPALRNGGEGRGEEHR